MLLSQPRQDKVHILSQGHNILYLAAVSLDIFSDFGSLPPFHIYILTSVILRKNPMNGFFRL